MKSWILLAGVVWIAGGTTHLQAASPEYCAFYAREYSRQFEFGAGEAQTEREIEDQAYYRCLNQDEDPPLPDHSAYSGADLDNGADPIAQGDGDYDPPEQVETEHAPPPTSESTTEPATEPATITRNDREKSRSGRKPWSAEWLAWCRQHFPNSFDAKTGFVLPYTGRRSFC